jgi:hypothetical protein
VKIISSMHYRIDSDFKKRFSICALLLAANTMCRNYSML